MNSRLMQVLILHGVIEVYIHNYVYTLKLTLSMKIIEIV